METRELRFFKSPLANSPLVISPASRDLATHPAIIMGKPRQSSKLFGCPRRRKLLLAGGAAVVASCGALPAMAGPTPDKPGMLQKPATNDQQQHQHG